MHQCLSISNMHIQRVNYKLHVNISRRRSCRHGFNRSSIVLRIVRERKLSAHPQSHCQKTNVLCRLQALFESNEKYSHNRYLKFASKCALCDSDFTVTSLLFLQFDSSKCVNTSTASLHIDTVAFEFRKQVQ